MRLELAKPPRIGEFKTFDIEITANGLPALWEYKDTLFGDVTIIASRTGKPKTALFVNSNKERNPSIDARNDALIPIHRGDHIINLRNVGKETEWFIIYCVRSIRPEEKTLTAEGVFMMRFGDMFGNKSMYTFFKDAIEAGQRKITDEACPVPAYATPPQLLRNRPFESLLTKQLDEIIGEE
jgi:hypothetical protein